MSAVEAKGASRFEGRVALVTGASSGIGREIARGLAAEGASVGAVARSVANVEETVAEIEAAGGRALALPCDVGVAADVEAAIAELVRAFGGLDLIAHAAGVSQPAGSVVDLSEEDWDTIFDTNAKSCFLLAKYGVPAMRERGGGAVVNLSSVVGTAAVPRASLYAASKAAVSTFTRVVALGHAKEGIRFNAVAPGLVRTPMLAGSLKHQPDALSPEELARRVHPLGRLIEPGEVAKLVLFLLSDDASAIAGSTHHVDGGWLAHIYRGDGTRTDARE